jgi:hypothetical protein
MNTGGAIVLVIILLLIAGGIGWIVYTRVRASQLGVCPPFILPLTHHCAYTDLSQLPPPPLRSYIPFLKTSQPTYGVQPAPGGIIGWINDRIRIFRNRHNRTAAGAYEGGSGPASRSRRGFGPLDPDEAWDSRVGAEADYGYGYEEQELGLHSHADTGYAGVGGAGRRLETDSYPMNLAATPGGGRSEYGVEEGERGRGRSRERDDGLTPAGARRNPFEDDAEPSNISLRGVSPRPIDTEAAGKSGGQGKDGDSPTERRSVFRENM